MAQQEQLQQLQQLLLQQQQQIQLQQQQIQLQKQPTENYTGKIFVDMAVKNRIFNALIFAGVGLLISIILIIIGIYIITSRNKLISVEGVVTKSSKDNNCSKQTINTNVITTCEFDVTYQVLNQSYIQTFLSTDMFSIGDKVTVWYNPNKPYKAEYKPTSTTIGWLLIGISVLIISVSVFMVWRAKNDELSAIVSGSNVVTKGVTNFIKDVAGVFKSK